MIHSVAVTLIAVAIPLAASVRLPVAPEPASRIVSDVIERVMTPAEAWLMKVMAVPIGYATLALLSIVHVRAVVSAEGWKMCFWPSVRTVVYAALLLFCGMLLNNCASP